MRIGKFLVNIFNFVFIANTFQLFAQVDFSSKQIIDGVAIFRDTADPLLFYYEPGDLILNTTANGEPDFNFLDLRYTGTKCSSDSGEKKFMSIVQFGVTMQKIPSEKLKNIKSALKKHGRYTLKPLPISHINTRLIIPVEKNNQKRHEPIENEGILEANDKSGFSSSNSFWTKRTYTIRLNQYESQLLNQQLKDNLLGINLNYVYHSNVSVNNEQITGSKELVEKFEKDSLNDTSKNIQNRVIKSNTLTINVNTKKYPDIIKQVDLNEEIPPTYAAIEVKCYDFKENLRPELYMKTIEIEATSVSNDKKIKIKTKFRKKYSDLYSQSINFPYAVNMNAPMRYRITEITKNGDRSISEWIYKPECNSIIDITSSQNEQNIKNEIIDIEMNPTIFEDESITKVKFNLHYFQQEKQKTKTLTFSSNDDLPLKSIRFAHDKNSSISYSISKNTSLDEELIIIEKKEIKENYIYFNNI